MSNKETGQKWHIWKSSKERVSLALPQKKHLNDSQDFKENILWTDKTQSGTLKLFIIYYFRKIGHTWTHLAYAWNQSIDAF